MVDRPSRSNKGSARKPHFFKVLLGDFKQSLRIPPKFMKHISNEASKKAILRGPNGSSWQVGLRRTINGAYLSAGWPNFVEGHSLKEHEFLVFRYDGSMRFTVQIFDTTACEREDVFEVKTPKKASPCEAKKKKGRPAKHRVDVRRVLQHQPIKQELLNAEDKHGHNQIQGRHKSPGKPSGNAKIKIEDAALPIYSIYASQTIYLSRRRPVTEEERSRAQEAANAFSSIFPYIVLRMTITNVYKTYMMRFPSCFSRENLPRKRTNMVIRDPSGKAWVVIYIPSERDRLSGGWSAFARGNNLEEGDFCAFELVGPIELRVHIFRVVEETTPVVRMSRKGR